MKRTMLIAAGLLIAANASAATSDDHRARRALLTAAYEAKATSRANRTMATTRGILTEESRDDTFPPGIIGQVGNIKIVMQANGTIFLTNK